MTAHEIRRRMPHASEAFIKRNAEDCADSPPPSPEPQRAVRDEPLGKSEGEEKSPDRVRIRVISFRRRLIDPDNLCPKYHVDCLRYCGFIRNDTAQDIILEVSQRKVQSKAEECTRIEIQPIAQAPVKDMTRAELIEAYWANCSSSWNRPAFDVFMETMDEETLRQYIQMGTT